MQASNASTPITGNISTIFIAIELSQKSWLVTMHCPDRDKISRHKLEGGDHAGLLGLIDRLREQAELPRSERLHSATDPDTGSAADSDMPGDWS